MPDNDHLLVEYQEALSIIRHHDTLLWSIFSVYFGITGALLNFVPQISSESLVRITAILGIVVSLTIFLHVKKSRNYYKQKSDRAKEIEKKLGLQLMLGGSQEPKTGQKNETRRQKIRRLSSSAMNWALITIILLGLFWAVLFIEPSLAEKIPVLIK